MNNKVFYDVSNNSLNLTYSIIDILVAVLFFVLVFWFIYKAFLFTIRTIGSIISTLFGGIIPKKENYKSYEDDLSSEERASRRACFADDDNDTKGNKVNSRAKKHNIHQPIKDDKPKLQIEAGKNKTFEEMMNNKSKYN